MSSFPLSPGKCLPPALVCTRAQDLVSTLRKRLAMDSALFWLLTEPRLIELSLVSSLCQSPIPCLQARLLPLASVLWRDRGDLMGPAGW